MGFLDFFKLHRPVSFEGGPGDSIENAIIIRNAFRTNAGIEGEYFYLTQRFGQQGQDWDIDDQIMLQANNRRYDKIYINLADGTHTAVIFDITDFYGKY